MSHLALDDGEHEIRRRLLAGADHPHRAGLPAGVALHLPLTNRRLVHDVLTNQILVHLVTNQSLVYSMHDVLTNQSLVHVGA